MYIYVCVYFRYEYPQYSTQDFIIHSDYIIMVAMTSCVLDTLTTISTQWVFIHDCFLDNIEKPLCRKRILIVVTYYIFIWPLAMNYIEFSIIASFNLLVTSNTSVCEWIFEPTICIMMHVETSRQNNLVKFLVPENDKLVVFIEITFFHMISVFLFCESTSFITWR